MNIKKYLSLVISVCFFCICSCNKQSDFDRAMAYQNDGEYTKAIKLYKSAINKKENAAIAEKNLGDIYFIKEKYDIAFKHYKNSIEINADVALARIMQFISYSDENLRNLTYNIFSNLRNDKSKSKMFEYLREILKSNDQYKILDALEFIAKLKEFFPISEDIISLLNRDDIVIKQKVLTLLPSIPQIVTEKGYMDKVVDLLNQDNEILKGLAIDSLGNMYGWAQRAIPTLIRIIVEQPNYKKQAWQAIEKIGIPTKEQIIEIFDYIKDKNKDIKIEIIERLGNKREGANSFVPYLLSFLNDEDKEFKQVVRDALSKIGKATKDSIPELTNLLNDKNDEIVSRAIYELGTLGNASSQAIEPLKQIAEDENRNKDLRELAKNALQKIQK